MGNDGAGGCPLAAHVTKPQEVNIETLPQSGSGATLQIHASTSDATFWSGRPWGHAQRGVVLVLHGRMRTSGDEVEVWGRQEWRAHKALLPLSC